MATEPVVRAEPGYGAVADAFLTNFTEHGEVGAAFCLYRDGRPVVDAWGGIADPVSGRTWQENTLALMFSATKGPTALAVHLLAERGVLDLDTPVAKYWPEFGAAGKEHIPVRWVMSHRAGIAAVDADLTLHEVFAWDPVIEAIAAQAPQWEPGTAVGYHARTFGWILGEVVRRITGQRFGGFFAREIAAPLGLDFWIGLPEEEEERVAVVLPDQMPGRDFFTGESLMVRVMSGPSGLFAYNDMWNRRDLHAAEMPSSNGIGDARSLARVYAATIGDVDGMRLLRPETVERAAALEAEETDLVIGVPTRVGTGLHLGAGLGPGVGPRSFGHPGAGGSTAWADPEAGIAFAYVANKMRMNPAGEGDPRTVGLTRAVYAAIG
ncbi:CubicO group peptidase (beta-lactamase class C family) [Streptosporangium album]|uniref:CubicO group peptidase (Beta-lactamase class C family) n=1 Tax=Streptosporangium album TaxID=47479 RepID=A0A7W7S5C1_9ACTN|nr:serine hydrolase domain-containing protein [Streptosporangium album]MBB4944163.1 CubicO group peptidase (beta-lactamase class C family) [Streptosporangium album]